MEDTIAAISTAQIPAGIGVLRISGSGAIQVADKIFTSRRGKLLSEISGYTALFGKAHDGDDEIDECIALVFRAPHSYTGEDVVELSCHGGPYIMKKVLQASISAGARLAQAGEFTKRAFLNGKLDLTSAEAVMDLIGAQGETAAKAALTQHNGALFKKIGGIKSKLIEISADIAAWVDFPEEGVPSLEPEVLKNTLELINTDVKNLMQNFERGRVIREGLDTAIIGRPNVGKSTLMNAIAGFEKSIVTQIPGTTRDIVEESVSFGGTVLRLYDTAGLRETDDPVEKIGVERAKERLSLSQIVFAVFDGSNTLTEEDKEIIDELENKKAIAIINKCDLPQRIDIQYILPKISHIVYVSATKNSGIDKLESTVEEMTGTSGFDPNAAIVANERQLECVRRAADGLQSALEAENSGMTLDAVSVGIEDSIDALYELTGEKASDDVIDRVFSKFCIGK